MSYTRMTFKPRMAWYKKLIIFLIILSVGIFYFGRWLPKYLVLEEGVSLDSKPKEIFSCLIYKDEKNSFNHHIKNQSAMNFMSKIFPDGNVTEIANEDYMTLSDNQGSSLTITIEDEGDYWLAINFEQNLGDNPLNRIYQNWLRTEKEQAILTFLSSFQKNYKTQCK